MDEKVLLELPFYGKMKFIEHRKMNMLKSIPIAIIVIGVLISPVFITINEKTVAALPKWYWYIPIIFFVIMDVVIKILKALFQKQNFIQISTIGITFLDEKRNSYKNFYFENIYWLDYSVKTTEDSITKDLTIFTNDKDETIYLDKFSQSQIDNLISKLQELNLDVRHYDY